MIDEVQNLSYINDWQLFVHEVIDVKFELRELYYLLDFYPDENTVQKAQ